MRQSLLTITGLTLIAITSGCATSGTTTTASTSTVGLKSLDADVVLSGTTPEVGDGTLALEEQPVASSGLWMNSSPTPSAEDTWFKPTPRIDNMYKLMQPTPSTDVAYTRTKRRH